MIFSTFINGYICRKDPKHLEKLVWSETSHASIKMCELKVTVKLFVIQAIIVNFTGTKRNFGAFVEK